MAEHAMNDWLLKGTVRFVEIKIVSNFFNIMRLWLSWKSRQYEFVRIISIVENLVFSGVLRGAGGRHV